MNFHPYRKYIRDLHYSQDEFQARLLQILPIFPFFKKFFDLADESEIF